jgi:hypothetical protein
MKQTMELKGKQKIGIQINGKCNNVGNARENK